MNPVTPYVGQSQPEQIRVPATIAYKYLDWEEGPWVMPPYASIFGVTAMPVAPPRKIGDRDASKPRSVLPPPERARPITRRVFFPIHPHRMGEVCVRRRSTNVIHRNLVYKK